MARYRTLAVLVSFSAWYWAGSALYTPIDMVHSGTMRPGMALRWQIGSCSGHDVAVFYKSTAPFKHTVSRDISGYRKESDMAHITLLAYPNFSVSSLTCPIDAFGIANMQYQFLSGSRTTDPLFTWDIVSVDGKAVTGFGGIPIQPHSAISEIVSTDFILIPGFLPPMEFIDSPPREIISWLRDRHDRGTMIGTVCTGSFLLAETGLLSGKSATTNWAYAGYFRKRYPDVNLKPERVLTVDGNLVCSGATTAFLDLCIYLIETFGSADLAARCAKLLLTDVNRRSQAPYFIFEFQKGHADDKILRAQEIMEKNMAGLVSFDAMAGDLGISPRHFKRRFKQATGDPPQTYLQRLRIETTKRLLETTMASFEEITWQVGYENCNSFRRLFKKFTDLSPGEYRHRFNHTPRRA